MKKINKKQKNEIPTLNNKQIINSKRKRHNLVKIKKIKKIKKRISKTFCRRYKNSKKKCDLLKKFILKKKNSRINHKEKEQKKDLKTSKFIIEHNNNIFYKPERESILESDGFLKYYINLKENKQNNFSILNKQNTFPLFTFQPMPLYPLYYNYPFYSYNNCNLYQNSPFHTLSHFPNPVNEQHPKNSINSFNFSFNKDDNSLNHNSFLTNNFINRNNLDNTNNNLNLNNNRNNNLTLKNNSNINNNNSNNNLTLNNNNTNTDNNLNRSFFNINNNNVNDNDNRNSLFEDLTPRNNNIYNNFSFNRISLGENSLDNLDNLSIFENDSFDSIRNINNRRNTTHRIDFSLSNNYNETIDKKELKSLKKNLEKSKFVKNKDLESTCAICIEEFKRNQNIYKLPCSHIFHVNCLNKELENRQKCPICRKSIK